MTRSETLLALAARAEAGGDATLSDDVWRALGWEQRGRGWLEPWETEPLETPPHRYWDGPRPELSRSIDAQEAVGPAIGGMQRTITGKYGAIVYGCTDIGTAPTEPLARLAAKLRALATEAGHGG